MGDRDQEPTEFERFEDLTRKLLKVPKDELKQKLVEHKNAAEGPRPIKPSPETHQ